MTAVRPTVLPLTRAAENQRRVRRLLILFAFIAFPSVAYVAQYLAFVFLLWVVPVFGVLGWPVFLTLDFLLVFALMAWTYRYLHRSATRRLLSGIRALPLVENDYPEFRRAAQNMSIASGVPMPQLWVVQRPEPNLISLGLTAETTAIVATEGALSLLERRELEGAVAHTFAQIASGDTRLDTLIATGVRFLRLPARAVTVVAKALGGAAAHFGVIGWIVLALLAAWMLVPLALSVIWGLTDPDFWWICWIALFFLVYVFLLAPLFASLVARRVARERKHLADAEAVQLTRFPVGLARALAKLDAAGSAQPGTPPELANLYLADPIPAGAGWWSRATDTHPSPAERIEVITRLGAAVPDSEIEEARRAVRGAEAPAGTSGLEPPFAKVPFAATLPSRGRIRVLEDVPLLTSGVHGSQMLGRVAPGEVVYVTSENDQFIQVTTADNVPGWISKRARTEPAS